MSLGAFVVLTLGLAYGPRLGRVTLLAWLGPGAAGLNVFQNTASGVTGLACMMGATGGCLVGYLRAVLALGWAARRGLDRSVGGMALALVVGNVLLYVPGLVWLHHLVATGLFDPAKYASAWDQTLAWGLTPFIIGDLLKLALAALVVPGLWRLVGSARA